jgi:hypothetical protein
MIGKHRQTSGERLVHWFRAWNIGLPALAAAVALAVLAGCGSGELAASNHRVLPPSDARVVVLPVALPAALKLPPQEQRTLAAICTTEVLRAYDVMELERFELMLEERKLTLDDVLEEGTGKIIAEEMGVDALIVSEVYSWTPGKRGLLFLAQNGTVGFQGRLVDLATGNVLWSTNRVISTEPMEPLPIAVARMFGAVVEEMPRGDSN